MDFAYVTRIIQFNYVIERNAKKIAQIEDYVIMVNAYV